MKGKKVLITRPEKSAKEFKENLEKLGAIVKVSPMIELKIVEDLTFLHQLFEQLDEIDWIVFTSPNAVSFFFKAADDYGVKFYFYPELKIATVGDKTKLTLEHLGYRTNFVPIKYTAEVLAENMDEDIQGKKVVIPRSALASDEYLEVFRKRGAEPLPITLYENEEVKYNENDFLELMQHNFDYLTFASGSAFSAFHNHLLKMSVELSTEKIICIGPSTEKRVRELGYVPAAVAEEYTANGMIEVIKKLENA